MKLSIIIVSYNQENYILKALESILIQNIPFPFEIIVADDSSTDKTFQIIKNTLSGVVENLKFLDRNNNIGISKNYQRSFNECKGDYIAIMEGDDYWIDPNRLINHVNFLENHLECVMSMNRFIIYNEVLGDFIYSKIKNEEHYTYINAREMASGNKLGNLSACVFRKSEIDLIKQEVFEFEIADWMLGLVLSQNGLIGILEKKMSVYRVHDKGEWSKLSLDKMRDKVLLKADIYNKYFDYKYDKEFKDLKIKLKNRENMIKKKTSFKDFIPPILLHSIDLVVPLAIKKLIFIKLNFKKKIGL